MAKMVENLQLKVFFIIVFLAIAVLSLVFMPLKLGLDLKGGSSLIYAIPGIEDQKDSDVVNSTIEIFQKRINTLGLAEIKIRPAGRGEIQIELPGKDPTEVRRIKDILESLGKLEWRLVLEGVDLEAAGVNRESEETRRQQLEQDGKEYRGPLNNPNVRWFSHQKEKGTGGLFISMKQEDGITGEELKSVSPSMDDNGMPAVRFEVKPGSAHRMEKLTEKNKGKQLAILFNDEIVSAPKIESTIPGAGIIRGGMGGFSREEQNELVVTIQSGSLEIKPELRNEETVGASLGEDGIKRGMLAILIGAILVLVFMTVYYRKAGLIANTTLICNFILIFGALKLLGATLTLSGFAGLILTVGMAVDANILIFERIREEREKGKTLTQAVKNGYEKAFWTIFDANVTTLITAFILLFLGTGPVQGFATVLVLGILASLFSSLVISKVIFFYLLRRNIIHRLNLFKVIGETRIPFVTRYAPPAVFVSILVIAFGMVCFFQRGEESYGLDFTGGTQTQIRLNEPLRPEVVREMIDDIRGADGNPKYEGVVVQSVQRGKMEGGKFSNFAIKAQVEEKLNPEFVNDLKQAFKDDLIPPPITRIAKIPPKTEDERLKGFAGGWDLTLHFERPISRSGLEERLNAFSVNDASLTEMAQVKGMGDPQGEEDKNFNVQLKLKKELEQVVLEGQIQEFLKGGDNPLPLSDPIPLNKYIGKAVAGNLWTASTRAILLSLVAILLYIRFRFKEFKYGLGAVLALAHDVLIALGAVVACDWFGIVQVKIDVLTIAAFLTIIGYSLNDTIVIFDRIRENLGRRESRGLPFKAVVNHSINQTLSRTIFTSLTTMLVVLIIFVVNYGSKNDLEGFSFALIIGVAVGTYSSIFIASPFLLTIYRMIGRSAVAAAPAEEKTKKKKVQT